MRSYITGAKCTYVDALILSAAHIIVGLGVFYLPSPTPTPSIVLAPLLGAVCCLISSWSSSLASYDILLEP